jgi:hypothetical protein
MPSCAGSKLTDARGHGMLANLALAKARCPPGSCVLAATTDYCFPPHFPLVRFVEATFVSGRVTVAATSSTAAAEAVGAGLIPHETANCSHTAAGSSQNRMVSASVGPPESTRLKTIPVVGLPPAAADAACALAVSSHGPSPSLEDFLALHSKSSGPLTGFQVAAIFSVRTVKDLLLTDRFFAHWKTRLAQTARVRAMQTLIQMRIRSPQMPF